MAKATSKIKTPLSLHWKMAKRRCWPQNIFWLQSVADQNIPTFQVRSSMESPAMTSSAWKKNQAKHWWLEQGKNELETFSLFIIWNFLIPHIFRSVIFPKQVFKWGWNESVIYVINRLLKTPAFFSFFFFSFFPQIVIQFQKHEFQKHLVNVNVSKNNCVLTNMCKTRKHSKSAQINQKFNDKLIV